MGMLPLRSLRAQINKIDMSTPQLLAENDAKMIQGLNTLGYFKYIFLTVFGVMLPEFETKGLVKFKTSNPCCYEHKTNPSPLQC